MSLKDTVQKVVDEVIRKIEGIENEKDWGFFLFTWFNRLTLIDNIYNYN